MKLFGLGKRSHKKTNGSVDIKKAASDGRLSVQTLGRLIVLVVFAKIDVANHVEVIVVDVDDFNRVFIQSCVWDWPASNGTLGEVNGALVVSVVQLCWSDEWNDLSLIHI